MITLTDGTTTIELHPDLYWSDEYTWAPVEQAIQRTVTGALVVSSATRQKGRPITLGPQEFQSAWMPKTTVDQLRNWSLVAGKVLTLTLRGTAYSVIFRHQDTPMEATPIVFFSEADATDWYSVTLRFMEV